MPAQHPNEGYSYNGTGLETYNGLRTTAQAHTSPATEDFRNLHGEASHIFQHRPASITSTSPVSLTFSSDGTSLMNQPSYTTTPSESTADLPRHMYPGQPEPTHYPSVANNGQKVKAWVPFNAGNLKGRRDKHWRKCLHCAIRKLACEDTSDSTRCLHCEHSTSYCKGPVETPSFANITTLNGTATAAFASIASMPVIPAKCAETRADHGLKETQPFWNRSFLVQAPLLLNEFPYLDELSGADMLLDTLLAVEKIYPRPTKAGLDLTTFEGLCRRFCACLVLLRSLDRCTADDENQNYHHVYHLAIGFICRMFLLANGILGKIFDEIRTCCDAKRHTTQTPKLMSTLGFFLGQMLAEIRRLRAYAQSNLKLPLLSIMSKTLATEERLRFFGMTFDNEKFTAGTQQAPFVLPGIHLQASGSSNPPGSEFTDLRLCRAGASLFDVLNLDPAPIASASTYRNPSQEISSKATEQLPSCIDDMGEPDASDAYPDSFLAVRRGVLIPQARKGRRAASKHIAETVMQLRLENTKLRAEMEILQKRMLDNEEEIAILQASSDQADSLISDNCFDERCSTGHLPVFRASETETAIQAESSVQAATDVFNTADLDEVFKLAQDQYPVPPLPEIEQDVDTGDVTETEEAQLHRKRKRTSPALPSKKQKDHTQHEQEATSTRVYGNNHVTDDDQSLCFQHRKRSSTIVQLKKRFSGTRGEQNHGQTPDKAETAEQRNTDSTDNPDAPEAPFYEHRPKTWPLRQALRQSVDISVKTLVKGFERLKA